MYDPEMEKNHQNHWEKNLNTDWIQDANKKIIFIIRRENGKMDQLKIKSPSLRDTDWCIYRLNDMMSTSTSGENKSSRFNRTGKMLVTDGAG